MRRNHGIHLAYCTNIHRGGNWAQTFESLRTHTMAVRRQVAPEEPYAIGLRLGEDASRELESPEKLQAFKDWLKESNCYVFTINGFPYGHFHGERVKEQVYRPDWSSEDRLSYTQRLFELLLHFLPEDVEGSVSTLPGSFKEFITDDSQLKPIRDNLWRCIDFLDDLCNRTGRKLHLGLEPEPLGLFETTGETVAFFESMQADRPGDDRLKKYLGVNYDTCHLAVEYEEAEEALKRLSDNGIMISKLHLSSALKLKPGAEAFEALRGFADDIYLHQVVARDASGSLSRFRDLDVALDGDEAAGAREAEEWRVHFHVPLHSPPTEIFQTTADHLEKTIGILGKDPGLCRHLEMETYTWEVLPSAMKNRDVVDQLVAEYHWTLDRLQQVGI